MVRLVLLATGLSASVASAQLPRGDAAAGQKTFARCAACHAVGPDARNKIGPQLNGMVNRKAATVAGFTYSAALQNAKLTWTPAKLDAWLLAPAKLVPGNKMLFMGLPNAADRANVIAYIGQYGPTGATKK